MNFLTNWWNNQKLYRQLAAIKQAVDGRITYTNRGTNDRFYVPEGTKARGDCEAFAETYLVECGRNGIPAYYHTYTLPDGQRHAICVVQDHWILDCRERWPVRA